MKNLKIKIQRARIQDIDIIYKLGSGAKELQFSKKMKFHDKVELKEFILKPKDNILLTAIFNDKIVGFLYAKIVSKTWCILDNLVVYKDYRSIGIGTSLLHHFYKILKNRKINYIQILEDIHHKKTRKFWKDMGFKEEKVFVWADKIIR
jgi:GNAT superfamily N-acetyltransferase